MLYSDRLIFSFSQKGLIIVAYTDWCFCSFL